MTRRPAPRWLVALAIVAAGLAVAGCGGASQEEVDAIETKVANLQQQVDQLEKETALVRELSGQLEDLRAKIDELRDKLPDLDRLRELLVKVQSVLGALP